MSDIVLKQESTLTTKTTPAMSDLLRLVGSDDHSYKTLVSDVAKAIIETYAGSTVAGSAQSVKSALDALNSKLGNIFAVKSYPGVSGTSGTTFTSETLTQGIYLFAVSRLNASSTAYDYIGLASISTTSHITPIYSGTSAPSITISNSKITFTYPANYVAVAVIQLA